MNSSADSAGATSRPSITSIHAENCARNHAQQTTAGREEGERVARVTAWHAVDAGCLRRRVLVDRSPLPRVVVCGIHGQICRRSLPIGTTCIAAPRSARARSSGYRPVVRLLSPRRRSRWSVDGSQLAGGDRGTSSRNDVILGDDVI